MSKPRNDYPTALSDRVRALPSVVDQAQLNERGLFVMDGLDQALALQLVESSTQPHIREFCPNDPTARFASLEQVRAWQSKGRLALPLVQRSDSGLLWLAGFGWMGPGQPGPDEPELPGATTTFAIRIYTAALGQGHALPYTRAILGAHGHRFGNEGVWLEAWADNAGALRTYERAGFQLVVEVPGTRHGRPAGRVYMTLR
jgi:RimJ/RimL family protein N-acetyltransferase